MATRASANNFIIPERDPDTGKLYRSPSSKEENRAAQKRTMEYLQQKGIDPAKLRQLPSDIPFEVNKFPLTEKEVADAKQAFVEAQKVGRTGDAAIAGQIVSNLNIGRTFAHTADLEKAILALTPSKIADAFRKHVDPKKLVVIRAGDFKK